MLQSLAELGNPEISNIIGKEYNTFRMMVVRDTSALVWGMEGGVFLSLSHPLVSHLELLLV